ncbi:MAG: AraC family transcriptional regulator [Treponemataceae bacterium]|nr:AraC family transcriptional regulator [Treponemataceae bacterium]
MSKTNKSFNRQLSVYHSIFMSYIISAVVTLAISGLGFLQFYRDLNTEVVTTANRQLEITTRLVERTITDTYNLLEVLSNDTTFKSFTTYDSKKFHRQNNDIRMFRTNLTNNASLFQMYNEVYFYFTETDSLFGLNTRRYSDEMFDLFFTTTSFSREDFYRYIDFKGVMTSVVLPDGKVWFMRSCYDDERQRVAVIIADLKTDTVVNQMHQYYPQNSIVLSTDDTILLSSLETDSVSVADLNAIAGSPDQLNRLKVNGATWRAMHQRVAGMGWHCFVLYQQSELYTSLFRFWRIAAILIAVAIGTTIIMARRLTSRTYAPVKQMISMMHEEGQGEFPETYDNVIKALTKLKTENKKLQDTDKEYRMKQLQASVRQVLNGEIAEAAVVSQIMQEWVQYSEDDVFSLALIHLAIAKDNHVLECNEQGLLYADSIDLLEFVLRNVFEEKLFSQFKGDLINDGKDFVLYIHCSKAHHTQVINILTECMNFLRKTMKIQPTIIVSDSVESISLLNQVYTTLTDELKFNQFWQSGNENPPVIQLGNLEEYADKFSNDRYVMQTSRLMNYLEVQDFIAAWRTLDEIVDTTFPKDRKHLKQNLYRMYGLIDNITTYMDIPDDSLFSQLNYEEKLFAVENITEFKLLIHEIFDKIIEYKANTEDSAPVWVEQVDDYIKKNFRDINLTVSSLADTFDVSVSHLSRTFKQYTGTGALDRIHEMRIAAAKELLLKGVSVEETAQQCGYLDAKALRRAFSNYEGITPGKFREAGIRRVLGD